MGVRVAVGGLAADRDEGDAVARGAVPIHLDDGHSWGAINRGSAAGEWLRAAERDNTVLWSGLTSIRSGAAPTSSIWPTTS